MFRLKSKIATAFGVLFAIALIIVVLLFVFVQNISISVADEGVFNTKGEISSVNAGKVKDVIYAIEVGLFGELESATEPNADTCMAESYQPINALEYFGRVGLSKETNGELLIEVYDKLVNAANSMEQRVLLADFDNPISDKDFEKVFYAYTMDYPQHFWVSSYSCINYKNVLLYVDILFNMEADEVVEKKKIFTNYVQTILNELPSSLNEYQRELWIHDYLISTCTYTEENELCHTSYGCLIEKQAVCDGYAKAFTYLCRQVGLNTTIAQNEDHAWNIIQINGDHYITDVTWDDSEVSPECPISYEFFNVTTEQYLQSQSHAISLLEVPQCTARTENYYIKNNALLQNCSLEELVSFLKNNSKVCRAYITIDSEVYRKWLEENFSIAARKAGFSGSGQTYIVGQEIVFIVNN